MTRLFQRLFGISLLLCGLAHAELASHTSFKGEVTAYTYDVMGREVTRTFADGQQVRTTYTATGQVASVTDARGTTTYAYDARDRVIRIDTPDGHWLAYAWDGNGNRTALITPTGTTTYAYDDGNRLVQVTDPAGQVTTYAWDEAGNLIEQTLPNGVSTFRTYDDNGQLEAVRHEKDGQVLARYIYTRDEDGRRVSAVEEQLDPATGLLHSRTLAWTYDELGRLASETLTESGHTTTTAWTHDEVGNRLSEARFRDGVLLATDRYAYDANDRLTRAWTENGAGGTVSESLYRHDANGATTEVVRTGGFSRTYAYDAAQRLVQVQDSTGQRITYGYDAQGNRVTQSVQQSPELALNGSWRYLVDPLAPFTEVVATLTDTGQAETEYRFGAGRIAELTAGQLLYYGEDGHHSVRLITDAQGHIVAHLNYDAFGNDAGSVTDDASGAPAARPAFRYTGQQWDGALGEYYLRARTYDPAVGRFTQRDSWQGNSQRPVTLNAYAYADADPVGGWDPSGYQTIAEASAASDMQGILASIGRIERVLNFYSKANSAIELVTGLRQLLVMFEGDLTASVPRRFPARVDFSDAASKFSSGALEAFRIGNSAWLSGYAADYGKGKRLTAYVLYLPVLLPQFPSLWNTGRKINDKPVMVGLGAPRGSYGSLGGIGVVMGNERQLFRMDIGLTPAGHITGRGNEIDTFDKPPFSFHVYNWTGGPR